MQHRRRSNAERFWEKVDKSAGPDACWPWIAFKYSSGYGMFMWRYEDGHTGSRPANRCALGLHLGRPIPRHLHAAHSCRDRSCCNPRHLSEKTPAQNSADMIRDGTKSEGERHARAKLTEAQVLEILSTYRNPNPPSFTETGRRYGVSRLAISRVVRGLTWKHVPREEQT